MCMKNASLIFIFCIFTTIGFAQPAWKTDLDSDIRFYQSTDFGILLAGTDRNFYALDGRTGEIIWRQETGRLNETAIAPVPETDLILVSKDLGSRSRLEAVDLISGSRLWQSDKVKGDVLQLAADPESDLVAVVMVKDTRGSAGDEFKRTPIIHVLRLSTGEELWKRELDSDIQMMPARFGEDLGEINYTLDNYHPPLLLDGRLYLFYEGATSYDARTGEAKEREKFNVNEGGLALTEADAVVDDRHVYVSGRGRIRAIDRKTGEVSWKADDIGVAAEMALIGNKIFVRTGGQFTRLKDGEVVGRGPYGLSAIDPTNGEVLWRFKGADKGLTNFVFTDADTIALADRDDLIFIDAQTGKRRSKIEHQVDRSQFILLNEGRQIVLGGQNEMAAFSGGSEIWRVRHKPPARGAFRIVAGIALRAAALYFRYGGIANSAFGLARGGFRLANAANSFRWSGLRSRFGSFDLTTLAGNSVRDYVTARLYSYGSIGSNANLLSRVRGLQIRRPNIVGRITPSRGDIQQSIFDRVDPIRRAERLSDYLLRRKRISELRGNYMYFYTDLAKPFDRKGLVGVNIHTGRDGRFVLLSDPDSRFITDETLDLAYSADGRRLQGFDILNK